jgi:hypothetical protein
MQLYYLKQQYFCQFSLPPSSLPQICTVSNIIIIIICISCGKRRSVMIVKTVTNAKNKENMHRPFLPGAISKAR